MDRRNFLRTGGMALLGSLAAGSVLAMPSSAKGAMGGGDQKAALLSAMNHFGVSEENMRKVLAAALEKGGDYADLFFEHTFTNVIGLKDGAAIHISISVWEFVFLPVTRADMLMWKM